MNLLLFPDLLCDHMVMFSLLLDKEKYAGIHMDGQFFDKLPSHSISPPVCKVLSVGLAINISVSCKGTLH